MSYFSICLIGFALAMDAFAVALSSGMIVCDENSSNMFRFGIYFGFFQFLMTVLGFVGSFQFSRYIMAFDHWIAFVLLGGIGAGMIRDSLKEENQSHGQTSQTSESILSHKNMLLMAVATSIDAMAVGISLSFFKINIIQTGLVIGIISFVISYLGYYLGCKLTKISIMKKYAQFAGGGILIFIGCRILFEHLSK